MMHHDLGQSLAGLALLGALAGFGGAPAADEAGVRDPTLPPAMAALTLAMAAPARQLALQGTLVAGQYRGAVVNGELVGVGDTIGAARITAIEYDRVELRDPQGDFSLHLPQPPPPRPFAGLARP